MKVSKRIYCMCFVARGVTIHDPVTFTHPPPEKYVPDPERLLPDFRSGVHKVLQDQKQQELEVKGNTVWHLSDQMLFTEGKCLVVQK